MFVAVINTALHLLHFGENGIEVKFRLGREFGNKLVQGDFALGAAGHIVGIERLAVNFLAVLLYEPEGFLNGLARGCASTHPADFLGGEDPANIGFAVVVGIALRVFGRLTGHAHPQYFFMCARRSFPP